MSFIKPKLETRHGDIFLPAFMPDATYGFIRCISFKDAETVGVSEIVTTTLHLEQKIGSKFIKDFGGIHKYLNWSRPIFSDSGGWQVFSLINAKNNPRNLHRLSKVGATFINPINGTSSLITPETSIQIQLNIGSDVLTVLDNPVHVNSSLAEQKRSVEINTDWARRAKKYFDNNKDSETLKISCVVQGGDNFELRKRSALELTEIGFDVYNFGGLPLNWSDQLWRVRQQKEVKTTFFREMLEYVSSILPVGTIKYAMGVGKPVDIAFCVDVGWQIFDTVLPTRNARHGLLFVSEGQGDDNFEYLSKSKKRFAYDHLHLKSARYIKDDRPVDENCDCECCRSVSRAYLRHLIRMKEPSGLRLATIHNLRFYIKWMEKISDQIGND